MKFPGRSQSNAAPLLVSTQLGQNNFDLIRLLLSVTVIYSHCFVIVYGTAAGHEPVHMLTRGQTELGGIAVSLFFAISGFLIVRSFEHSRTLYAYFLKRCLRIVPGFVVAFLLSVFVFGVLGTATTTHPLGNWKEYLHQLKAKRIAWQMFTLEAPKGVRTFLQNPLPNRLNEALWTIQYEFICYLLVPVLSFIGTMGRKRAVLLFFILAYACLILQTLGVFTPVDNEWNLVVQYPSELSRFFTFFSAGAVCYLFRHRIVRSRYLLLASGAFIVMASQVAPLLPLVLPLCGTYLLFYVAYHPRILFHHFAMRGDFSYGLYLYGWPLQQLLVYFFAAHLSAHLLFAAALPLVFAAAYASWRLVEKPFIKLKQTQGADRMGFLKTSAPAS